MTNCLVSAGWCQLVDVNLHICNWSSADFSWWHDDKRKLFGVYWLMSTGRCEPVQMSLVVCRFQLTPLRWCHYDKLFGVCWLMSTGRCQPAAQMSLVVWWPASFASLARCCLMTRVVSRLQLMSPHLPLPLLFSVRNVKNARFASMKYFVFCTQQSNNPDQSKGLLNVVFSFMGGQIKSAKYNSLECNAAMLCWTWTTLI